MTSTEGLTAICAAALGLPNLYMKQPGLVVQRLLSFFLTMEVMSTKVMAMEHSTSYSHY